MQGKFSDSVNSSSHNDWSDAPKDHELELTVFGPGAGECLLIHLGSGDWFCVDSCKYQGSTSPAAIEYLEDIGIDPTSAIKRVLATHWHDDHVRGLSEIVRACPEAKLAISSALAGDQFFQIVLEVAEQRKLVSGTSTATEFAEILEHWVQIGKTIGPDFYAIDGLPLFQGGFQDSAKVVALSPSPDTVTNSKTDLVSKLLTSSATRSFKRFRPNDLSVAARVEAGPVKLLLGADLENKLPGNFGWNAVLLSDHRHTLHKADAFKVAHHGSSNADDERVWSSLLQPNPVAVVTPYSKLASPLPTDSDVSRIKSRTTRLYCTTWPPKSKPLRRQGVDGIVAMATKSRHRIAGKRGFVRIRFDLRQLSPVPQVEMFGAAIQL